MKESEKIKATKGIIFIGEAETGKTRTAKKILEIYRKDAVYLNGREFGYDRPFFFGQCKPTTKVVIIDEIISAKYLEFFMQFVPGKLIVNSLGKEPFEITLEKLIIVCSSEIKKSDLSSGSSFTRRFNVVEFPNAEISELFIEEDLILANSPEKEQGNSFDYKSLLTILKIDS